MSLTSCVTSGKCFKPSVPHFTLSEHIIVILLPYGVLRGYCEDEGSLGRTVPGREESRHNCCPGQQPCKLFLLPTIAGLNPCFFFLFLVSPRLSFSLSLNETIMEIGLPVHYLTQLFILCAHFMLGSDTSVDDALLLCIRKSICLSLPLDFSRAGPVGHTLVHPTHLVSPHSDPWSLCTACGLAWWTSRGLGKRQR